MDEAVLSSGFKTFCTFVDIKNIMQTLDLKKNFHNLIDSIDNEILLLNFYELIKKRSKTKEGKLWNKLSEEEQKDLLNTFEESKNPEYLISHDEIKNKHKKWL